MGPFFVFICLAVALQLPASQGRRLVDIPPIGNNSEQVAWQVDLGSGVIVDQTAIINSDDATIILATQPDESSSEQHTGSLILFRGTGMVFKVKDESRCFVTQDCADFISLEAEARSRNGSLIDVPTNDITVNASAGIELNTTETEELYNSVPGSEEFCKFTRIISAPLVFGDVNVTNDDVEILVSIEGRVNVIIPDKEKKGNSKGGKNDKPKKGNGKGTSGKKNKKPGKGNKTPDKGNTTVLVAGGVTPNPQSPSIGNGSDPSGVASNGDTSKTDKGTSGKKSKGSGDKKDKSKGNVDKKDKSKGNADKKDKKVNADKKDKKVNADKKDKKGNSDKKDKKGNADKKDTKGNADKKDTKGNADKKDIKGNADKKDKNKGNTDKKDKNKGNTDKKDKNKGNSDKKVGKPNKDKSKLPENFSASDFTKDVTTNTASGSGNNDKGNDKNPSKGNGKKDKKKNKKKDKTSDIKKNKTRDLPQNATNTTIIVGDLSG